MGLVQQQIFPVEQRKIQKHQNRKPHNQYFTPEFAVEKALSLIPETKIENIIDPAVGNGVFLKVASKKWKKANLFGVDIDKDVMSKLNKSNLPNSYYIVGDSLLQKTWQLPEVKRVLSNGGFDLVAGNPPFSSWFYRVDSENILLSYELGKNNGNTKRSQAIEVLLLEIFIKLAREGGFIAIVLPDGILSNPQYQYVREFISKNTKVLHIINLPRNVFEETSAKTSILILKKRKKININYFSKLHDLGRNGKVNNTVKVSGEDLIKRMDYYYYNNLQTSPLQELVDNGIEFKQLKDFVIYCKTGKTLYGKERKFSNRGLRFLHATNITDIGINYERDKKYIDSFSKMNFPSAYAKVEDILFVRVGVGCAGRVAIVDSKNDEGIATDYLHILRVKGIDPYFLTLYLKTKYGKQFIELLKHGVGTVSINKSDVCSIPIPIVSEKIQESIRIKHKNILSPWKSSINTTDDYENKMRNLIKDLEKILEGYDCER